jgi:ABC-type antimicrobial peptide transport system permease subunit
MDIFLQDLRFAIRSLRKIPLFALTLIAILSLGIGGTTTIFTILYGVILNPLPVKEPGRLVYFLAPGPPEGSRVEWWSENETFESLCEYRAGGVNLTHGDLPVRVSAAAVSYGFFSVFGVAAKIGQQFTVDDEKQGNSRLAILSDRLWSKNYGRDSAIIGRNIILNGEAFLVAGVMPAGFDYPGHTDIWLPLLNGTGTISLGDDEQFDLPMAMRQTMVGRLRQGVSLEQCRAEVNLRFEALRELSAKAGRNVGSGGRVIPLQETIVKEFRPAIWALFASVIFLLLIACSNVTNLLLTRAASRQKEIAIRLCLGASPLRIFRQMLTESISLALLSGLLGIALAYLGVELIRATAPLNIPRLADVHINLYALGFTLFISLLVGIMVGIAPSLQSLSRNFTTALKDGSIRSSGGVRKFTRQAIVVFEIATSLVMVIGAGLMMKSFDNLTNITPGFDTQNILTMTVSLQNSKYFDTAKPALRQKGNETAKDKITTQADLSKTNATKRSRVIDFHHNLAESIKQVSGVVAVGGVTQLPLNNASGMSLWLDAPGTSGAMAFSYSTLGDYFEVMGIPLVRGRYFDDQDTDSSKKVVIINESLANKLWEGENPIGRILTVPPNKEPREIVGIVRDVKQLDLIQPMNSQFYLPCEQPMGNGQPALNVVLVIRTSVPPQTLVNTLRGQVASLDRELPVFRVRTMKEVLTESIAAYRFRGVLMSLFAILAITLAVTGVYGVVSYSVSKRTHEIGIRMSLGANPANILRMILREGTVLAVSGVIIGVAVSLAINRFISGLLYGVSPFDFATLMYSAAILVVGALIASALPAWMASKIDPSNALRHE